MSEENMKVQSKSELMKALEQDFATTVNSVYINSLSAELGFREVTVLEQKTLSRIMINNSKRKDIIYDAQCALINKIALKEDFDVYQLREFDKLKLLMMIYQSSVFKNDIEFTCHECGTQNKYHLDFDNAIHKLDEIKVEDITFDYDEKNWMFNFTLYYPTVRRVSNFYKAYIEQHKKALQKENDEQLETNINIEYINLFIKDVKMTNKKTGSSKFIDLTQYNAADIADIISVFPQSVVYDANGVLKFITENFIKKLNDAYDKHKCLQCGAEHEGSVDDQQRFL